MAPFMIAGYKLGRILHLPQMKIKSEKSKCTGCGMCEKKCPMSLSIKSLMESGEIKSAECILCGECVSACKNKVLSIKMTNKRS
jgi:ferredoxin